MRVVCPLCANSGHQQLYSITSLACASSAGGTADAERLSRLEIDQQFVLGRCLHRKIGWLLAFEDAINVTGRTLVWLDWLGPIAN